MKKKFTLIMVFVIVLAFGAGVVAKNVFDVVSAEIRTDFVIEIDGVKQVFKNVDGEKVYPLLHDGTTYLPLRAIGEIMGKKVYWYEKDKKIEIKDEKSTVSTVTDADVIYNSEQKENKNKENKKQVDKSEFISEYKAKEIALKEAKLTEAEVSYIKAELDFDDGAYEYDVEIRVGKIEYEAEINAIDGSVKRFHKDRD